VNSRRLFRGLSDGRYYIPRRGPLVSLAPVALAVAIGIALTLALLRWIDWSLS
jgi:hypothetical protein